LISFSSVLFFFHLPILPFPFEIDVFSQLFGQDRRAVIAFFRASRSSSASSSYLYVPVFPFIFFF
jgi:hypothetical protein